MHVSCGWSFSISEQKKLFEALRCWCGWTFSQSSVWVAFQEKWRSFRQIHRNLRDFCSTCAGWAGRAFTVLVWFLVWQKWRQKRVHSPPKKLAGAIHVCASHGRLCQLSWRHTYFCHFPVISQWQEAKKEEEPTLSINFVLISSLKISKFRDQPFVYIWVKVAQKAQLVR